LLTAGDCVGVVDKEVLGVGEGEGETEVDEGNVGVEAFVAEEAACADTDLLDDGVILSDRMRVICRSEWPQKAGKMCNIVWPCSTDINACKSSPLQAPTARFQNGLLHVP
jgi:hypothetical protein